MESEGMAKEACLREIKEAKIYSSKTLWAE
jgi:hypothetical protein